MTAVKRNGVFFRSVRLTYDNISSRTEIRHVFLVDFPCKNKFFFFFYLNMGGYRFPEINKWLYLFLLSINVRKLPVVKKWRKK